MTTARDDILAGRTSLGIELGSTRIKACLIGSDPSEVLATGSSAWDGYAAACVCDAGVKALTSDGAVAVEMIERPALYL